jgi:CubicO group peptidase (beta-lactamase class C family)
MFSHGSGRHRPKAAAVAAIGAVAVVAVLAAGCAGPLVAGPLGVPGGGGGGTGGGSGAGEPTTTCPAPGPGEEPATVRPEDVGMKRRELTDAIAYASARGAMTVRVYRHGCLVGRSANDPDSERQLLEGWSMTKGVVSTVAGRAVAMGLLDVDAPIGTYLSGRPGFERLDAAHAAITVRQVLTQTSGVRMAWLNDLWAAGNADSAALTLARPFEAEPGTTFLYAQTMMTVMVAVVEAATGEELQSFAQRELFDRVGITRRQWSWLRDGAGRTQGFALLRMQPVAWARLGLLLVNRGMWGDERVLDADYVAQGSVGSAANPGYGFLWWTNRGEWHRNAGFPDDVVKQRRLWVPLPADAFAYDGLADQQVLVIPSLDMVVVRMGPPPELFGDPLGESPGLRPRYSHRFQRLLMKALADVSVPDPGDWAYEGPEPPPNLFRIIEPTLPPFGG